MQQSTDSRNGLRKRAITEGTVVLVFLVVWLIPAASAVHEGYGSIVAAVVYGATYGVLVSTLAIQLRLKNPSLIGVGVGLAFGLGTAAAANVFLSAAARVAATGNIGATIRSVVPAISLNYAIIPGLVGGVGAGFLLKRRMEIWRIVAIGGAAAVALNGMLGAWLYTPTLTWAAAGSGLSFGALSAISVAVAIHNVTGARVAVLHYGVPAGLSGAIASALIMLDRHVHVAVDVASTAPWVLLISAAAGAGCSAMIFVGQHVGSKLRRVGTLSLQDLSSPLADIKTYLRPLMTFMSVYILIAIWFGLWFYAVDHFMVPHSFLVKQVYVDGTVDTLGYTSVTEAVYYSFVTITTSQIKIYGDSLRLHHFQSTYELREVTALDRNTSCQIALPELLISDQNHHRPRLTRRAGIEPLHTLINGVAQTVREMLSFKPLTDPHPKPDENSDDGPVKEPLLPNLLESLLNCHEVLLLTAPDRD